MRWHILRPLIKKDLLFFFTNPSSLMIFALVIFMGAILQKFIGSPNLALTITTPLTMLGFYNTAFLFVEEKDKKTLEALMLSPASYWEILAGKLLVNGGLTLLTTLSVALFSFHSSYPLWGLAMAILLGTLIMCIFSTIASLIIPNQATVSSVGTAVMLFIFLPELLAPINNTIGYIARAIPVHHIIKLITISGTTYKAQHLLYPLFLLLFLVVGFAGAISFLKDASRQESARWTFSLANKIFFGTLAILMITSSIALAPPEGKIIKVGEHSYYVKEDSQIFAHVYPEQFNYREYLAADYLLIRFNSKENDKNYFYINVRANLEQLSSIALFQKEQKKWEAKKVNIITQKEETIAGHKALMLEFDDTEGHNLRYTFLHEDSVYHLGLVWTLTEDYQHARAKFDTFVSEFAHHQ